MLVSSPDCLIGGAPPAAEAAEPQSVTPSEPRLWLRAGSAQGCESPVAGGGCHFLATIFSVVFFASSTGWPVHACTRSSSELSATFFGPVTDFSGIPNTMFTGGPSLWVMNSSTSPTNSCRPMSLGLTNCRMLPTTCWVTEFFSRSGRARAESSSRVAASNILSFGCLPDGVDGRDAPTERAPELTF